MSRQITSQRYFDDLTEVAHKIIDYEERGEPVPVNLSAGYVDVCSHCHQAIMPPKTSLLCEHCGAVLYCSRKCSKADWDSSRMFSAPPHRYYCASNKRHMERLLDTQAILKQFPWGRLEIDGSFSRDIARGRYNVLGSDGKGFWSHKGGPAPHQNGGPFSPSNVGQSRSGSQMLRFSESFEHLDGIGLLQTKHLSDKDGWLLPPHLIPLRDFSSSDRRPKMVTKPVRNWDSWYRWRKLPKESIAPLIMGFPLSVYQLVVHSLKLTKPKRGRPGERVPLHIELLGVEVELNFLPIFAELALLLPYHDIKLVMYGFSVHKLVSQAKSQSPNSLAGECSATSPIFKYSAPKDCGSGRISIFLNGDSPTWPPEEYAGRPMNTSISYPYGDKPHALIACNAGLGTYPDWIPVIKLAHDFKIPFATTEYAEQSAEFQRQHIPQWTVNIMTGTVESGKAEDHPIELNPFQCPGQRGIPHIRLPNVINGFTLVVIPNKRGFVPRKAYSAWSATDWRAVMIVIGILFVVLAIVLGPIGQYLLGR